MNSKINLNNFQYHVGVAFSPVFFCRSVVVFFVLLLILCHFGNIIFLAGICSVISELDSFSGNLFR